MSGPLFPSDLYGQQDPFGNTLTDQQEMASMDEGPEDWLGGAQGPNTNFDKLAPKFAKYATGQINELDKYNQRSIQQQGAQAYGAQANQLAAGQRYSNQQQTDAMAAAGMAPSIFNQYVQPQQQGEFDANLGGLRAQSQAGVTAGLMENENSTVQSQLSLAQGLFNAAVAEDRWEEAERLKKYMAEISAQAQMSAAGQVADSNEFGAVLGLAGTALFGPAGGAFGGLIGSFF